MNTMEQKTLGIRPVAVFSKPDGTVDVMLDCDVIGQVFIKVECNSDGELVSDVIDTGETNWKGLGSFEAYVAIRVNVRQAGVKAVKHCMTFSDEWAIVGQENEFDIYSLKRNLPESKLQESLSYKTRFPLFGFS